jgi:hypothetical protein
MTYVSPYEINLPFVLETYGGYDAKALNLLNYYYYHY